MKRRDEEVRRLLKKRSVPRSKVQKQVKKKQEDILECFNQMNLRDTQINKIVQKMKQMLNRVEKGGSEIKRIEEKCGVSVQEARSYLKRLKTRSVSEKALLRTRKLSKADLQETDRLVKNTQRKINKVEAECGLSAEKLASAVKAIMGGETKAKEAKSELVKANLRLVV